MALIAEATPNNYGSGHGGGAVRWTAPELLEPDMFGLTSARPTYASDVYSFAVLCNELYTGDRPFPKKTLFQVMRDVVQGIRPERPGAKHPMSQAMWNLVTNCWNHSPQSRPSFQGIANRLHPKKKALLIGITCDRPLTAQKDVGDFKDLLVTGYGFKEKDIVVMSDCEGTKAHLRPTKSNILREIGRLVRRAKEGDSFVFLYAGNSDRIPNTTETEVDWTDEVIIPLNHQGLNNKKSLITDDLLRRRLVDPLPLGTRLTAIFDSYRSGTLLDLGQEQYACEEFARASETSVSVHNSMAGERKLGKQSTEVNSLPTPTGSPMEHVLVNNTQRTCEAQGQSSSSTIDTSRSSETRSQSIAAVPIEDATAENEREEGNHGNGMSLHLEANVAFKHSCENFQSRASLSPMSADTSLKECRRGRSQSPTLRPMVVSLSACNDARITWEDRDVESSSLIQAVIHILRQKPAPSIAELTAGVDAVLKATAKKSIEAYCEWKESDNILTEEQHEYLLRLLNNHTLQVGSEQAMPRRHSPLPKLTLPSAT
ncbi:caspase domain-containing protein [Cristinia sonorae]|uniref:Caspase domain-containing protein n=1 Tax=Cristinia sonorae TaxID=1940300 RepID=A0A8K0XS89_9AGAR|nr:caspase domain-containing protein [Cristinia sonorae]